MGYTSDPDTGVLLKDPPPAQPSSKKPKKNGEVPEFGGTLPNGAPAANGYDAMKPNGGQPPAPILPPGSPGNGPIFPQDPAQQVPWYAGAMGYSPTTAPFGFDLSAPGVREQFWNNNQQLWFQSPSLDWVDSQLPQFQDPWYGEQWNQQQLAGLGSPGAGQQYWNGVSGDMNTMNGAEQILAGGYKGQNNALDAYKRTRSAMPGSLTPQFDSYYDRMSQKAMSNVNSQSAARGVYGSNAALNNSIGAGLDVEAQRAKAATDFSLADSANQLNWHNSLSSQGRAADLSGTDAFNANRDAANFGLDKVKTYGDLAFRAEDADFKKKLAQSELAFGIDKAKLDRLGAGVSTGLASHGAHFGQLQGAYNAAGQAQNSYEDRVNSLYDRVSGFSNDVQDFFMDNYGQIMNGDGSINEEQLRTMIAQQADQRGWSDQQAERIYRDIYSAADAYNSSEANKEDKEER